MIKQEKRLVIETIRKQQEKILEKYEKELEDIKLALEDKKYQIELQKGVLNRLNDKIKEQTK